MAKGWGCRALEAAPLPQRPSGGSGTSGAVWGWDPTPGAVRGWDPAGLTPAAVRRWDPAPRTVRGWDLAPGADIADCAGLGPGRGDTGAAVRGRHPAGPAPGTVRS